MKIEEIVPKENILKILEILTQKLNVTNDEIIALNNSADKENAILPISIFESDLSPLETISKYLSEECDYSCAKIARLLNRSHSSVWNACKDANSKLPARFQKKNSVISIPIKVFASEKLSAMEALVHHVKSAHKLKFSEIAKLINRDEKTVWTSYDRAK